MIAGGPDHETGDRFAVKRFANATGSSFESRLRPAPIRRANHGLTDGAINAMLPALESPTKGEARGWRNWIHQ
jgi:hypothetical protein